MSTSLILVAGLCCAEKPSRSPEAPKEWKPVPPRSDFSKDKTEQYLMYWALDNINHTMELAKENNTEVKMAYKFVAEVEEASRISVTTKNNIKTDVSFDIAKLKILASVTYGKFVTYIQKSETSDLLVGIQLDKVKAEYNYEKKTTSVGYSNNW